MTAADAGVSDAAHADADADATADTVDAIIGAGADGGICGAGADVGALWCCFCVKLVGALLDDCPPVDKQAHYNAAGS